MQLPVLTSYLQTLDHSPLQRVREMSPWDIVAQSESIVRDWMSTLNADDYVMNDDIAIHRSAQVESAAILKGPVIIGPDCFIAAGAYVRGGCWLDARCILGPGAELKSSFMHAGSKLAHFNFVGDSIIGFDVNLEAGSIVANYRNEREDKHIQVRVNGTLQRTNSIKFGALLGDHVRLGANAVVAPGGLLAPHTIVRRAALLDQELDA